MKRRRDMRRGARHAYRLKVANPALAGEPLPREQQKAFDFIKAYSTREGRFPKLNVISWHMRWGREQSAYDCLTRLIWRGRLRRIARGKYEVVAQ